MNEETSVRNSDGCSLVRSGGGSESVPVPMIAVAVIAVGAAGYGASRIFKKNK